MKIQVLQPPTIKNVSGQIIFLAGPIQGTADWQAQATKLLLKQLPEITIANPRRDYVGAKFIYEKQVDWESYYLQRAAQQGVIMFWLAAEIEHNCSRAYGQTSRFEIAEWKERHCREGIKLVVGIEEGFSGARYIKHRFPQDAPNIPILDSLDATCNKVVGFINQT